MIPTADSLRSDLNLRQQIHSEAMKGQEAGDVENHFRVLLDAIEREISRIKSFPSFEATEVVIPINTKLRNTAVFDKLKAYLVSLGYVPTLGPEEIVVSWLN